MQDQIVVARAIAATVWGVPAVNFEAMYQAATALGGGPNQIVYWSRLLDWQNQTLTPNPDAVYLMAFIDTSGGPMVFEIPDATANASITGSIDSAWQTPLTDVGPAGADAGNGARYLLLPPGHTDPVPNGYIPVSGETYSSFALLRSNLTGGGQDAVRAAVDYGRQARLYPLAAADHPPETVFLDAYGRMFDATLPTDSSFFDLLDRRLQAEPWLTRDAVMIDQLATLGLAKGTLFAPDQATRELLTRGVDAAFGWLGQRYEEAFVPGFYPDSRWALPASRELITALESGYRDPNSYPVDARGLTYTFAFFAAKKLGSGQFYLMAIRDRDGNRLHGAHTYQLTVPANAPVTLYWSITAYDRDTHTLIRDVEWASRSSNTEGLTSDPDGSVTLVIGPNPPTERPANWIPTSPTGDFELLARFYGPTPALFDKTWRLPDIEPT
ncbi:DUF1214 domain-containing protein [Nocardia sp. NPDC058379]|uniref:DUF1214 domain-containing protein n=1 Tax=unclassified Nocardia TaxID=2637762 RepID=UPI003667A555